MAQYPIPQFIEEESKIVFFLTYRQFFMLVGGGAICFLLFMQLPTLFATILSIIVMGIILIITFLKINGVPVLKVVFGYFGFITQSKNYVWKKETTGNDSSITDQNKTMKESEDAQ